MRKFQTRILCSAVALLAAMLLAFPAAAEDTDLPKATHVEAEPLDIEFESLAAMIFDAKGRLLAADGDGQCIRVIDTVDSEGKATVVDTIKLPFKPESMETTASGEIYCGGQGTIVRINAKGKIVARTGAPDSPDPHNNNSRGYHARPSRVSGIAALDGDVYVAVGTSWSVRSLSNLYRFSVDLKEPKLLLENLRGCCQRCDIKARDGRIYIAENAAYRVKIIDREGEVLEQFGKKSREGLEDFGACCNPMNLAFDTEGDLYTSESGLGRVKRYSTDGKLLGLVGIVDTARFERGSHLASSCSNMAIAVSEDGKTVYVMDYQNSKIRVLKAE